MAASAFSVQPQLAQAQVDIGVTERHKTAALKRLMEPFIRISRDRHGSRLTQGIERAEACSGMTTASRSAAETQFKRETAGRAADERVGGVYPAEGFRKRRQAEKRWARAAQRL